MFFKESLDFRVFIKYISLRPADNRSSNQTRTQNAAQPTLKSISSIEIRIPI